MSTSFLAHSQRLSRHLPPLQQALQTPDGQGLCIHSSRGPLHFQTQLRNRGLSYPIHVSMCKVAWRIAYAVAFRAVVLAP